MLSGQEGLGIEIIVVDPPIDHVDPRQTAGGPHEDAVVLDQEVPALDQRHAHLARQEDVFEIGRIVGAGGQQDDTRIGHSRQGATSCSAEISLRAVVFDRAQADLVKQIRKGAQHHMPVFDDIAYPGGRPRIVLEDEERAALVPHDIGAADIDVGLVRQIDAAHRGR